MIKIAGSGQQVLETIAREEADLGYIGYSIALQGEIQSPDSFIVLHYNVNSENLPPLHILVAGKDSKITSVKDLKGKHIATFPGGTMLSLTQLMITNENISLNDVQISQLAPTAQVSALNSGQVDALLAIEPIGTFAQEAGAGTIIDKTPLTPRIITTMTDGASIMRRETFEENPEYVEKIIRSIDRAIEYIREHPDEMYQYYIEYNDVSEEVAKKLPVLYFWKHEEINSSIAQKYADVLAESGAITEHINVQNMYID